MATPAAVTRTIRIAMDALEVRRQVASRIFSVARWGLVAALMAAPLAFGAVQPWAWAALLVAALGLLLLWTLGNAQQGALRIYGSPLYLPAALFLVLCVAQLYGGIALDPYATRESIFNLVTPLVLFFLAGQLFAKAPQALWRELGLAVTLYAFSLGLFAILQFFSSHNLIYWTVKSPGWTFGPYVNHNDYAGLMEMLIPMAAAYVLSRPQRDPRRSLLAFSLCVPVASVLLSGSRGGFISLLVETFILGCILGWRLAGDRPAHFGSLLALGITGAALLFFWMAPNRAVRRLGELANLHQTAEVTYGQRERAARDTLHIFRDHPCVGIGLGGFETVFPQYRTFPSNLVWTHAHNDYAEALAETGLAGGTLMAWALFLFFRSAFRGLPSRLRDEAGWMRLGAVLGCCGLLVHSLADFNLHIPANAAWFAVCAALAVAPVPEATPRAQTR